MAESCDFRGNRFCLNHLNEEVKFLCEDCKQKACISCVSTTHKGHNLHGMKLVVQEKYKNLQELTAAIQETKIPRIRKSYQAAQESVKKLTDTIRTNILTAKEHGNYLKEHIDKSTAETVSELKALELNITSQLNTFQSECDSIIKRLEDLMKESKEAAKSDNDVLIVDIEEHMSTLTIDEPVFECNFTPATFIRGSINIKEAFGSIVYEQSPLGTTASAPSPPPLQPLPRWTTLQPKMIVPPPKAPATDMLADPIISSLMDITGFPLSIQRLRQGTLWFMLNNDPTYNVLRSIDIYGSNRTLKLDVNVIYLCCNHDQLYCIAADDNSIRAIDTRTGKTTKLFDCGVTAKYINITSDGSVFNVGTQDKPEVKLYNRSGKVVQTIQTVDKPFNTAVCRSTGRVAIACNEGGVMVMESKEDNLHHMYTFSSTEDNINAIDAAFDDAGHLLVPGCDNDQIYIADAATGRTLKTINIESPGFLTVHINSVLVVVSCKEKKNIFRKTKLTGKLMAVKYLA